MEFQRTTGIPVVIDNAASFDRLSENPDPFVGEIPVALSFHATKAFGCGEGGGILCTNEQLASRIARALNFGFRNSRNCAVPSMNGKMSEYHAAVGLAELDGWEEKHAAFRKVGEAYRRRFAEAGFEERFRATPDISATYAIFVCRDAAESVHIQEAFDRESIGFRLWYGRGLTEHGHLEKCARTSLRVVEKMAPCHLGIPWAVDLDEDAIERIVSVLQSALLPSD
jgi:dTDP-4-amino-4,6-dideoxygalactose transaminase